MANDYRRGIRVYLETSEYTKGIKELVQANDKLNKEYAALARKAENLSEKETKRMQRIKKELTNNNKVIADHKQKLRETEVVLNNLSGQSYSKLLEVRRRLTSELHRAQRGTREYNLLLEQHKRTSREVARAQKEMSVEIGCQANLFGKLTGFVGKYWAAIAGGIASITGLSASFRRLSEDVAHMDDVYSDVMKTTGMTREQVVRLNEEFMKMDTRTSREQLNNLARDAGKLGIEGRENILAFVDAGNQINVALGEDLGEEAIKDIGKMVGVFRHSTQQLTELDLKGQMLAVGSAVNELGASSTASERYLVSFAGRMGGVASQAGIAIDQILGFASALDQDMQQVEMAATALQKFIMKLMAEPAQFARLAGVPVKEFTRLLSTDANAAIKTVLRALNEKGGFRQLIPIFEQMGLDGARAVGVLSSMATGIDKIDRAQRIANAAMTQGTSITREYAVKNNNLQAQLEKARKNFKDISLELGQRLNPILLKSTNLTTTFIRLLVNYPGIIKWTLIALAALSAAYAYKYAVKAKNFALDKLRLLKATALNVAIKMQTLFLYYQGLQHDVLNGKVKLSIALQEAFRMTLMKTPWGWAAAAIAALGLAVYKYATSTTKAEKATKEFTGELAKEQAALRSLFDEYRDAVTSKERKLAIIKKLQEQYGAYLDDLTDEEGLLTNIDEAQRRANLSLINNMALKAKQKYIDEATESSFKKQVKNVQKFKKAMQDAGLSDYQVGQFSARIIEMFRNTGVDVNQTIRLAVKFMEDNGVKVNKAMRSSMGAMAISANELNVAKREAEEMFSSFLTSPGNVLKTLTVTANRTKPGNDTPTPGDKNKNKNKKDPADESLKQLEEAHQRELLALKQSLIDKQITEQQFAEQGEKLLLTHLQDKLFLQKFWGKSTVETETQIADWKLKRQKSDDELLLEDIKQAFHARSQAVDAWDALEREKLQEKVDDGVITNTRYQTELKTLELDAARVRRQIAEDYLAFVNESEFQSTEAKEKAVDEASKAVKKAVDAEQKAVEASNKDKLKSDEKYLEARHALLRQLGLLSLREAYAAERRELDAHLAKKLITEKEHARAVMNLKLRVAQDYAQKTVDFAAYVADAVSAYHQMEADSLEAQKQRELQAAGDNAEHRRRIEEEYAQKELDLKKKQANADAGIKIAQTIAAGALGAIQAFAQLGPIGGAVAAALIAITTAFQVASIIRQRNAIMATTLNNPGTSSPTSSAADSGARVANSQLPAVTQAAGGKWDVVGADDGITYRNVPYHGVARTGIVRRPVLVAERGDELIVDNPTLRNIRMNAPYLLREISRHRVPQYAAGKWNLPSYGQTQPHPTDSNIRDVMLEVRDLLSWLRENRIEAYTVLSEFEKKRDLRDKSLRKGSL